MSEVKSSVRRWLATRRWFGGKARAIAEVGFADLLPLESDDSVLALLDVRYAEGDSDVYAAPIRVLRGAEAGKLPEAHGDSVIHRFAPGPNAAVVVDALADAGFVRSLLDLLANGNSSSRSAELPGELRELSKSIGKLDVWNDTRLREIVEENRAALEPTIGQGDQSNSCIPFGKRLILKLFRRLAPGINPDFEIGRFLTQTAKFAHVPPMLGALEYRAAEGREAVTLGDAAKFVAGRSAWEYTLESLNDFFARLKKPPSKDWPNPHTAFQAAENSALPQSLWDLAALSPSDAAKSLAGDYLRSAALLGKRTAEMHLALASNTELPAFTPEKFTAQIQHAMRDSMHELAERTFALLESRLPHLPQSLATQAKALQERESELLSRFDAAGSEPIDGRRTRVHGDYHLGQVLYTGSDFAIIDLPKGAGPIAPRMALRGSGSPLVDVAGMLRSYHYAASQVFFKQRGAKSADPGPAAASETALRQAAEAWYQWAVAAFLKSYRETAAAGTFLPQDSTECGRLLTLFMLEKAVYELSYELNNRPDWVEVPLSGLLGLLERGD